MARDPLGLHQLAKRLGLDLSTVGDLQPESVIQGLHETIAIMCESVLPHAAELAGLLEGDLRAKFRGSRVLSESRINAEVRLTSDGTFQVNVYAPLMSFIWQCAKLWSTRVGVMKTALNPAEAPSMSWPETVERTRRILDAFWAGGIWEDVCPATLLSPSQLRFAGSLVLLGERFVVAHEFAHALIRLDSLGNAQRFDDLLAWARGWSRFYATEITEALGESGKTHEVRNWRLDDFEMHWGEEFAADLVGAKIALGYDRESNQPLVGMWALEALLIMFHMIESYHRTARVVDLPIGSHPYSRLRLSVVRSAIVVQDKGIKGWDVGQFFEELAEKILDHVRT